MYDLSVCGFLRSSPRRSFPSKKLFHILFMGKSCHSFFTPFGAESTSYRRRPTLLTWSLHTRAFLRPPSNTERLCMKSFSMGSSSISWTTCSHLESYRNQKKNPENSVYHEERVLTFYKIRHVENKNITIPQVEGPPSVSWGKPSIALEGSFPQNGCLWWRRSRTWKNGRHHHHHLLWLGLSTPSPLIATDEFPCYIYYITQVHKIHEHNFIQIFMHML